MNDHVENIRQMISKFIQVFATLVSGMRREIRPTRSNNMIDLNVELFMYVRVYSPMVLPECSSRIATDKSIKYLKIK